MTPSLRASVVNSIVRCKTCHYSLSGLTEHRCPECGNAFDPNDSSTYFTPPGMITRKEVLRLVVCCYLVNVSVLSSIALGWPVHLRLPMAAIAALSVALLAVTIPIGIVIDGTVSMIRGSNNKKD